MAIHPETAQDLYAYLEVARHADDRDGPLLRPMHACRDPQPRRCQLYLDRVHWVLQKNVKQLGLGHGYSAHAIWATFITTALENGVKLEGVQRTVGHADPATTQLYDRGRLTPEKSAALVMAYETTPATPVRGGEPDEVGDGEGATCSGEHPR